MMQSIISFLLLATVALGISLFGIGVIALIYSAIF